MRNVWLSSAALVAGLTGTTAVEATSITSYGSIVLSTIGTDGQTTANGLSAGNIPVPGRSDASRPAPPGVGGTGPTEGPVHVGQDTSSPGNSSNASATPGPNPPTLDPDDIVPDTPPIPDIELPEEIEVPETIGFPILDPLPDVAEVLDLPGEETASNPPPVDEWLTTTGVPPSGGGNVAETPEPTGLALLGSAGLAAWLASRRKKSLQ